MRFQTPRPTAERGLRLPSEGNRKGDRSEARASGRRTRDFPLRGRAPWSALLLLGALSCSHQEKPSILLLTLDTTRADALSCYSDSGAPTHSLDRLAREGILFESAFSCVPMTFPAHTSILTGLYPPRHNVRDNGQAPLSGAALTLAERALDEGYSTAAFVAAVVLDPVFGLDQGFAAYDSPKGDPAAGSEHDEGQRPGSEVVDAALRWLDEEGSTKPFFLWLHFYDPHTPYAATPAAETGCSLPELDSSLRSQYLRDVCTMDRAVGRVLDALGESGSLDHTIVLAIGDHGEAFGEHGEFGHSAHCFDTTLRVPMLLRLPDGAHAGERRRDIVSLVDVLPTLADLAGWSEPRDLDGIALLAARVPEDRGVYFESYYGYLSFGWSPIAGWLDARGKYIHSSRDEFYRLRDDPGEAHNRIDDAGLDLHAYQVPIARLDEAHKLPEESAARASEDVMESLRGLGYIAGGAADADLPGPLSSSSLPSPTDMVGPYERSIDGLALTRDGKFAEAIPILQEVRAVNPRNPFVLDLLANCLLKENRLAEAEPVLRDLVASSLTPVPGAWTRLGVCLIQLGRPEEALPILKKAVGLAPDRQRPRRELRELILRLGRNEEAQALDDRSRNR